MADAVFDSAGQHRVAEPDTMVLRTPYLRDGGPGIAARATARGVDWAAAAVEALAAVVGLPCPVTLATVAVDRWCPVDALKRELDAVAAESAAETLRVHW